MPYYPERPPEPSPQRQREPRMAARRNAVRLALMAAAGALAVFASVRLIGDLRAAQEGPFQTLPPEWGNPSTGKSYGLNIQMMEIPTAFGTADPGEDSPQDGGTPALLPRVSYPGNPELRISDRFLKLRKKGKYIIGYLKMDGLEEAVAQKDNTFFMDHDATGKKNGNGAIFLDEKVSLRYRPYTLILYGHNMKSGNMFGGLKKYRNSGYFYQHRMITFDTLYEEGEYAVFAAAVISATPGSGDWNDLWALDTESAVQREQAIQALERKSLVGSALDVRGDDQLLLLVTCTGSDTERMVVAARRLREGETADRLTLRQTQ